MPPSRLRDRSPPVDSEMMRLRVLAADRRHAGLRPWLRASPRWQWERSHCCSCILPNDPRCLLHVPQDSEHCGMERCAPRRALGPRPQPVSSPAPSHPATNAIGYSALDAESIETDTECPTDGCCSPLSSNDGPLMHLAQT